MRPLKAIKNTLIYAVIRVMLFVFSLMPISWSRSFFRGVGSLASRLPIAEIRLAKKHLALAFPDMDAAARDRIYRDCYRQLGASVGEMVKMAMTAMPTAAMTLSTN